MKGKKHRTMIFREADHKFEFTRNEFGSWIDTVLSLLMSDYPELDYSVDIFEVGDLSKYKNGASCGGATQGVIFTRQNPVYVKTQNLVADENGKVEEIPDAGYEQMMNWIK